MVRIAAVLMWVVIITSILGMYYIIKPRGW